jgi:diadenosine tetraphosphatase ApaH/serine/threonine PP2A family protein phosphatase
MLQGVQAGLIIYGHIHYVSEGVIDGQRIMSIGSVGFPFDGDQRAAYSIAEWSPLGG